LLRSGQKKENSLFVAKERASKLVFCELHERQIKKIAAEFLRHLVEAVPCKIQTLLTDNGIQFTNQERQKLTGWHIFDRVCGAFDIEHRLTKINPPWTNGQVERMNRTSQGSDCKTLSLRKPRSTP